MGGGGSKPDGGKGKKGQKGGKKAKALKAFTIMNEECGSAPKWKRIPDKVMGEDFFGYIVLPRGGFLVETESCGPIQFGIPPETIKDSMLAGLSPPKYFFILSECGGPAAARTSVAHRVRLQARCVRKCSVGSSLSLSLSLSRRPRAARPRVVSGH